MSRKREPMRRIKEVLRLAQVEGLSDRQIAGAANMKRSTVRDYILRARQAGLAWSCITEMSDDDLERKLFPPITGSEPRKPTPNMGEIHRELHKKSVTLQLLWDEYRDQHPDGYGYSRFCELYQAFAKSVDLSMRQVHRAGEKLFVDYSGLTASVVNPKTGEIRAAQIFVGVMGASNFTYAEATWTQGLADWTASHVRMFQYLNGVPAILVPDNLKSGVTKAWFYDPVINPTYQRLAEHYNVVVLPTRARKPRDKAKAEAGVLLVQRWILAALRNRTFFSLHELNLAIRELLERLNDKPFRKLEGCRRSMFELLDRPLLKPLPATPYEFDAWKKARVNVDYHVELDGHRYSVPYQMYGNEVEIRSTATIIDVYFRGRRIASHPRSGHKGGYTTLTEHMPARHRAQAEWTPARLIEWARSSGQGVADLIEAIMASKQHPEQGFRGCLGIMRLGKKVGKDRLAAACRRALAIGGLSYRSVLTILEKNQERLPIPQAASPLCVIAHENLRGADYFRDDEGVCNAQPTNH